MNERPHRIVAICRNCGVHITQLPSGAWVPADPDNIMGFCVKKRNLADSGMAHEPMPAGLVGAAHVEAAS